MRDDMRKLYLKFGEGYDAWEARQARLRMVQLGIKDSDWRDELVGSDSESGRSTKSDHDLEEC
jgi:hypothetical protein